MRELQDKQVLKRGQWLDTNALSGKDWGPRFDWFKTNVDKKGTINMLATLFDIGDQAVRELRPHIYAATDASVTRR